MAGLDPAKPGHDDDGEGSLHHLPQLYLRHLLQRRTRQFVDKADFARLLEVGQLAGAGGHDVVAQVGRQLIDALCGMTKTTGTSSNIGCFFATTAASRTPGTSAITCSISEAATFSPPIFSMSMARSPYL